MEGVIAVFIPITFLIIVGLITKWISDNRLRRELINASATPEFVKQLMASPLENADSSLKWGIVSIAIGIALGGIQMLHLDAEDPLTYGVVFIFGGAGLLLFYVIKARQDG